MGEEVLLSPGSIVLLTYGNKVIIIGYIIDQEDNKLLIKYVAVPSPGGYSGPDSMIAMPYDSPKAIIYEAPRREEAAPLIRFYENLIFIADHVSASELNEYIKQNAGGDENGA